jgi:hypothetical protein
MIRGEWFITPHAVERFRQMTQPDWTYEEALDELVGVSQQARPIRALYPGVWLYRTPKRRVDGRRVSGDRLVVSYRLPGAPQLVTVLPRGRRDETPDRYSGASERIHHD